MKKTNILYWIFTGLFAFFMLGSAIPDILIMPMAVEGFKGIGYPAYLVPFLGWAKLLGVIGILVPGYPRIKEWAYAGLMYDIIGAIYSVAFIEPIGTWAPMLIIPAIGAVSYVYYCKRQQLRAATNRLDLVPN
ncbi:DoxX family protein [Fibrella forsythiae]|uniref:DoxX family protein n=1 Tax=Fibrella forsythiae TaxID=2817061 RepID=A0ABS3JT27_9BACT|nr:DoxX family protein [Fibrella forsythiae]MBO0952052.1 DoxX family protein [Fibrella forsythiae]